MTTSVISTTSENANTVINIMPGTRLTAAEIAEHEADDDAPAVYVSTYHKYNCGSLRGLWVDVTSFCDSADLFDFCRALHADEEDPEFMFQDFQNFPRALYGESMTEDELQAIIDFFNDYSEDDREAIAEYWDEIDDSEDPGHILDCLVYSGDFSDYAQQAADEMISCTGCNVPDCITRYFDYEAWERDLAYDYSVTSNYVFLNH